MNVLLKNEPPAVRQIVLHELTDADRAAVSAVPAVVTAAEAHQAAEAAQAEYRASVTPLRDVIDATNARIKHIEQEAARIKTDRPALAAKIMKGEASDVDDQKAEERYETLLRQQRVAELALLELSQELKAAQSIGESLSRRAEDAELKLAEQTTRAQIEIARQRA
jgi:predicted  nucleic acid-binding Zn-ribbon protein